MTDEPEHETTYSWPQPDLFRADCSCGWAGASPDRDLVEARVDEHDQVTGDGIDWAEVARMDQEAS